MANHSDSHLAKLDIDLLCGYFEIPGRHPNVEKELEDRMAEDVVSCYNRATKSPVKLALYEHMKNNPRFEAFTIEKPTEENLEEESYVGDREEDPLFGRGSK
jgi:hypothetical protein